MDESRPGYYAIIPADVRYDDRIPPNAKLLYGEISALIGAGGYCYASNQYFSQIYKLSAETISRLISKLEQTGYIKRDVVKDNTGQIVSRKLFLSVSMPRIQPPDPDVNTDPEKMQGGIDEKINTPPQKNQEGIDEKVKETNTSITNNPLNPPEGGDPPKGRKKRSPGYKPKADVLPERFDKFWIFYRTHVPEGCNAGNRQKAIAAWDKLAPSNELVTSMARALAIQVESRSWASGIGVPHASTWLNNHGWEDDWGAAAVPKAESADIPDNEEAVEWVH